jgi:hypothetical protein
MTILESLHPDYLWHVRQALRFGPITITTRMTVVRLLDGSLWVHSPISPSQELIADLSAIGDVRYVIAPNKAHHLFFLSFLEAYPKAQGWVAPGLKAKRPDLQHYSEIAEQPAWSDELQAFFIDGLPIINETVWFQKATGTLILTDLLFCFGPGNNAGLAGAIAKLLGVYGRLGMSRTMKFAVKDKAALARSVKPLLSLPVERIILAHDQIIEDQALTQLRRAFAWLL